MEKITKIGLALLFLGCLADMPYGYFQFVRFVGMIGFGVLAFQEKEKGNDGFFIFWLLSAVLINPIFKISLGRGLWNTVDVIWAVVLIATIFYDTSNSKKN
jgi:FtsH-binding integral membrane protein